MVANEGKSITPLDRRFFVAMREEVEDVLAALGDKGKALSPIGLREASSRLAEVARFADVFATNGLEAPNVEEIAIPIPEKSRGYKRLDEDGRAKVVKLRRDGKSWKQISDEVGASAGTCRAVFLRAGTRKGRAKAKAS